MTNLAPAILITGATGFIGAQLARRLTDDHHVIAFSRGDQTTTDLTAIKGNFCISDDLQQLDDFVIECVVHLAAEVGGCTEEAGIAVNVCGTRTLLRYLIDRGCKRYILASSVAATGSLSPDFLPDEVPIGDDHRCLATDAYGFSKGLMEEVAYYFHRQVPELDITILRLGAVFDRDAEPVGPDTLGAMRFPFVDLGAVSIDDVLRALEIAANRPASPGIRRMNVVSRYARTSTPIPEALEQLLGDRARLLDLSNYRQSDHEMASVYRIDRLADLLGFVPTIDVRTMTESSPEAT